MKHVIAYQSTTARGTALVWFESLNPWTNAVTWIEDVNNAHIFDTETAAYKYLRQTALDERYGVYPLSLSYAIVVSVLAI